MNPDDKFEKRKEWENKIALWILIIAPVCFIVGLFWMGVTSTGRGISWRDIYFDLIVPRIGPVIRFIALISLPSLWMDKEKRGIGFFVLLGLAIWGFAEILFPRYEEGEWSRFWNELLEKEVRP